MEADATMEISSGALCFGNRSEVAQGAKADDIQSIVCPEWQGPGDGTVMFHSFSYNLKGKVNYILRVHNAGSGKKIWEKNFATSYKTNQSHGEQDRHPVLLDGRIFIQPHMYDLKTGREISTGFSRGGHGCGQVSASTQSFFFRGSTVQSFDLLTQRRFKVTEVSRVGCWINAIPSGGLLLVPEASSGCTCKFGIQASMAFRPFSKKGSGK